MRSFTKGYYVLACTRSEILLIYPDGTHKLQPAISSDLSCVNIKHVDDDGVIYFYAGYHKGGLQSWRLSKSKGFTILNSMNFGATIKGILFPSINDTFVFTENALYYNGQITIRYVWTIECFDVKQAADGEYIVATGHPNGTIKLFKNSQPLRHFTIDSDVKWISGVKFFTKLGDLDPRMAVIGHDGILRIFDYLDGSLLHKIAVSPTKKLIALDVLEDKVYVGGEERIVKIYQINS